MKIIQNWRLGFFAIASLILLNPAFAQKKATSKYEALLTGKVVSAYTGEVVIGATVYFPTLEKGTTTGIDGSFEIVIPKGTFKIVIGSVNMKEESQVIDVVKDVDLKFELREEVLNLNEVTVYAEKQDMNVKSLDVGKSSLDIEKINSIPSFMGEPDVIKSLMLMPGVTTVGEGASGYNVRGGSVDQNLIMQDGGLIFNPSHVFGFFSAFNPSVVKNATLYKSGISARYGGRLSSVLNVDLKEGDLQKTHVEGGVGLVSSKLAIQGPVIKNKLSFLIGGRVSYSDWLLHRAKNIQLKKSSAKFQDFNVKLSYILNDNNKLSYSGYYSADGFSFASDTTFKWTTQNHVLKWDHIFSDISSISATYATGRYMYDIESEEGILPFTTNSKIDYQNIRIEYERDFSERNNFIAGSEVYLYEFAPGHRKPLGDANPNNEELLLEDEKSVEGAIYLEDEYKLTSNFSIRGGLRYSFFANLGPGSDYLYGPNDSRNANNIVDTVFYENNEVIAQYGGFEPRLNLNYELNSRSSIKASYNRTRQYLHLVTNTAAVTPTDVWKTSNYYIPPEIGDQYSLGYFRNFNDNTIEASIEGYYKKGKNIVEFKNGSVLLMNPNIEASLINGNSESYGVEFFLNKKTGKFTGWLSYTWSRAFRQVAGIYNDEIISLGNAYPANHDKPHDFTAVMNYQSTPLIEYGINFTYSTGRPTTAPQLQYDYGNLTGIFGYSLRNEERIPDYHRLDVSMTIKSKPKIDRRWRMSWTIAIYNVYGRKNAYSVFYKNVYGSPPRAYKLAVLGSAFPSLMVNFEF